MGPQPCLPGKQDEARARACDKTRPKFADTMSTKSYSNVVPILPPTFSTVVFLRSWCADDRGCADQRGPGFCSLLSYPHTRGLSLFYARLSLFPGRPQ